MAYDPTADDTDDVPVELIQVYLEGGYCNYIYPSVLVIVLLLLGMNKGKHLSDMFRAISVRIYSDRGIANGYMENHAAHLFVTSLLHLLSLNGNEPWHR